MALDPVVGIHSGRTLGVEAVMDNAVALGYASTHDLLDAAFDSSDGSDPLRAQNRLLDIETAAHQAAVRLFAALPDNPALKLFLNLDSRLLANADRIVAGLRASLSDHGIAPTSVVLTISERMPFVNVEALCDGAPGADAAHEDLERLLATLRGLSGRLALADFGAGSASLPLLTLTRPDFVKLDRFFVQAQARDRGRRLALQGLVNLAQPLGTLVIAEGVETVEQYQTCRQAGCEYLQGPLAGPRVTAAQDLPRTYEGIRSLSEIDHRRVGNDAALIAAQTEYMAPITMGTAMAEVFECFRQAKDQTFLPAVDAADEPVGIIREADLKEYTYSLYGKDLLSNRALGRTLDGFVVRAPVADVTTPAEKILDVFSASGGAECVLITRDRKYMGFLSASSLLKVISEKNLAMARDQNPLSRLPGNTMINEYIFEALHTTDRPSTLVYLDFDNFKPFNDTYGYRQGDRAITLFAELLRKALPREDVFVGHVGGDDFFVGFRDFDPDHVVHLIGDLIERFRRDVESFYDEEARRTGFIVARDREGVERHLPLLTASAAVIEIPRGHSTRSADEIAGLIARYKKKAKESASKIAAARLDDGAPADPTGADAPRPDPVRA
ncbi:EAL domain-containing protein [Roseospira navarrensis]|uniref:EAL domain-containing protein n=2 Tax=Roseospira navarrensis TaxID=140058 RepID=A0A7X1ZGQ7_9PROT|nr:EAL domain-containing protein [Roseospira navarrensis]